MKQRGRISAAALSIAAPVDAVPRPDAPYDLTDEESSEWWAIINRMPADWFQRETHSLLAQLCRHIIAARRIAQLVHEAEKAEQFDVLTYDRLLKMQERESRAIASLSVKLRIAQSTAYDRTKKRQVISTPWDG